jgi:hypothetical protein
MQLDMDRVTAQALTLFEQTDMGITLIDWMNTLADDRKERLVGHRGIASIPDIWHDQGFIQGVLSVAQIFQHAEQLVSTEDEEVAMIVPDPAYEGASSTQPRR